MCVPYIYKHPAHIWTSTLLWTSTKLMNIYEMIDLRYYINLQEVYECMNSHVMHRLSRNATPNSMAICGGISAPDIYFIVHSWWAYDIFQLVNIVLNQGDLTDTTCIGNGPALSCTKHCQSQLVSLMDSIFSLRSQKRQLRMECKRNRNLGGEFGSVEWEIWVKGLSYHGSRLVVFAFRYMWMTPRNASQCVLMEVAGLKMQCCRL